MTEYARAGGRESTDAELKLDLLRILPREIREMLLWHSTDVGVSFQRFRDTVVAQTAAVLMNRGSSRAVHAMNDAPEEESYRDAIFRILDDCGQTRVARAHAWPEFQRGLRSSSRQNQLHRSGPVGKKLGSGPH